MIIKLTPEADLKLKELLGGKPGAVRLIYDTEGCGCAVNGVPGLQIVDGAADGDTAIQTNGSIPLVINGKQEVFFEEELKLDLRSGTANFRLTSRNQTYGTNIIATDTRV
ncbi:MULTISPECIES: iron-sulfur cluster biosynthesis family protein [Paenibacillus]|uniref:iron-sulfur cluster biosynthesis family protein n=1 Tax=Paenibacillus TaxID=44249 RepID=UPI00119EC469|nr:iron-sulfur cluster biosynthesis family protein [Paenibacillus sp. IHBB 10380]